jgi:phosphoenolpyruvate-protein kinase (PTS system EI component)
VGVADDPKDIDAAVEANAEGVGLFRTEFCFLERTEPHLDVRRLTSSTQRRPGW